MRTQDHLRLIICLLVAIVSLMLVRMVYGGHPAVDSMPRPIPDELAEIFADEWTLWYDESNMIPAMQFGPNAAPTSIHYGRHRFNQIDRTTNANSEYPWRDGGGLHRVDKRTTAIVKFFWHPKRHPVRYFRSVRSSIYYRQRAWDWMFPVDSVVGELLAIRRGGYTHTFEVRTLTRDADGWQPRVWRQYNDLAEVAAGLERIGYDGDDIRRLPVQTLKFTDTTHPRPAVSFTYRQAMLPEFPEAIVEQLLRKPLEEAVHPLEFTARTTQLVPANYEGSQVGIEREDCAKCHSHVAVHVNNFDRAARDWYGYVRGGDRIFTFHPFAHSSIAGNGGRLPVRFSRELTASGHIAPYNGEAGYTRLK